MGKLPGFTFYPGDWQKDPSLRRCCKAAKGVWMDMLCLLFECPSRGVFVDAGGRPWGDEEIAAAIGGDMASNLECIRELLAKGVAQRDARGAIFSRRMVRDEQERQAAKERKRKQRSGQSLSSKDDGFHPTQTTLFATPRGVGEELTTIDQIAHLHPKNAHLKNKPVPLAHRIAIADAIARDGEAAVISGTESLAVGVAEWDPMDKNFAPNPIKFYEESEYLKPRESWQRQRKQNRSEKCLLHPQAALTEWGECGECYGNKYVSGCQPA